MLYRYVYISIVDIIIILCVNNSIKIEKDTLYKICVTNGYELINNLVNNC